MESLDCTQQALQVRVLISMPGTSMCCMPFGVQDRRNALAGIDILRKICNHPDLLQRGQWEGSDDYGNPKRSGKLLVALKVRVCNLAADWQRVLACSVLCYQPLCLCMTAPAQLVLPVIIQWQGCLPACHSRCM